MGDEIMKKKEIFLICTGFIIITITAMLFFVLTGRNDITEKEINLCGTWEVVAAIENESVTLIDNEFMVFDTEMAYDYRDNILTPYVSSKYMIDYSNKVALQLPDINRTYVIEMKSDNYICLYENPQKHMRLIRYPNEERTAVEVNQSSIIGRWNVVYRNTTDVANEILEFGESDLIDYRNESSVPYATSTYFWDNNICFTAEQLNKTMEIHPQSEDVIILLETDTADIWELKRIE